MSTTSMTKTTNASAAHALKHDVCNIMAAKVGAYLKPKSNFLMDVTVEDWDEDMCVIIQRIIFGFSYKNMKFSKLVELGEGTGASHRLYSQPTSVTLEHNKGDSPEKFLLHLGDLPDYNNTFIDVNERTYEDGSFLDPAPEIECDVTISFIDIDNDPVSEIEFTSFTSNISPFY
jgi:hypothetical protein